MPTKIIIKLKSMPILIGSAVLTSLLIISWKVIKSSAAVSASSIKADS